MNEIKFVVPGNPYGKQRPKFVRQGNYTKTYTPNETVSYENLVKLCYKEATKDIPDAFFTKDTPLSIHIEAFFAIPKSVSKKKAAAMLKGDIRPTKKPDVDNIAKVICDSLNSVAFYDDAAIAELSVSKYYADVPEVIVSIKAC